MASLLREYVGVVVGVVVLIAAECGGGGIGRCEAAGGADHVVGGDQGWDAASDVAAWSTDRVFRVGDNIWFTYSASRESIIRLGSKEEFESCELSNPIKMYTSGLDRVVPQVEAGGRGKQVMNAQELAAGPEPSGSTYITSSTLVLIGFALLCFVVL
ncbi:uncharacterized protein [Elaeis guineensis]|uniref:uncharacterized protein isoform X2 n=1 Tax=Elaeis guineensis var. tenera TaxID=51953 RepID=UPI00057A9C12